MLLIAVAPKLVPSRHASRWTRNHGHDSPVWAARKIWKAMNPIGASSGAISDPQSRRRWMAMNAATAQAATSARPFGRVAVASAAATPASSQRSSSRNHRHRAARTMSSASA